MIEAKYVETKNKDFWYSSDKHLPEKDQRAAQNYTELLV